METEINLKNSLRNLMALSLRRSTQHCCDCKWCGIPRQEYDDEQCDKCGIRYQLNLYFEPFGTKTVRIFGNSDIVEIMKKRFKELGGIFQIPDGWIFDETVGPQLSYLGIEKWHTNSEVSAQRQYENDCDI